MASLLLVFTWCVLLPKEAYAQAAAQSNGPWDWAVLGIVLMLVVAASISLIRRLRKGRGDSPAESKASIDEVSRSSKPYIPGSIFLSYRRADSSEMTGRIYDSLVQHFGSEVAFRDLDSIPLGVDFREHVDGALAQCRVVLAVIGANWLRIENESGRRRLDDTADHLRLEIETALKRQIPVIPILIQGASMPQEADLPDSMKSLAYRNGIPVRTDPDFHNDMGRLIRGIESHLH